MASDINRSPPSHWGIPLLRAREGGGVVEAATWQDFPLSLIPASPALARARGVHTTQDRHHKMPLTFHTFFVSQQSGFSSLKFSLFLHRQAWFKTWLHNAGAFPKIAHVGAKAVSDGTVSYGVRRLANALKAGASSRTRKWHFPVFYPLHIHVCPMNPARRLLPLLLPENILF